jgi:tetratricopeptide (TPR) repeat protein
MNNTAAALQLRTEGLRIKRRDLGDNDDITLQSMVALSTTHKSIDNFDAAIALQMEAHASYQAKGSGYDRYTFDALAALGGIYLDMGQPAMALPLASEYLKAQRRLFGDTHPDTAGCVGELACVFSNLGDHARAGPLFEEALAVYKSCHASDHPAVQNAEDRMRTHRIRVASQEPPESRR